MTRKKSVGDKSEAVLRLEDDISGDQLSRNIAKMSEWLGHKADSVSRQEDKTSGGQLSSNISKIS